MSLFLSDISAHALSLLVELRQDNANSVDIPISTRNETVRNSKPCQFERQSACRDRHGVCTYRPSGSLCLQEWEYSSHKNGVDFEDKIFPYFPLYRLPKGYENGTENHLGIRVYIGYKTLFARL